MRARHSFTPSPHSLSYAYIDPTHQTTMSNLFAPPPPPPTKLGLYRQLSPLAGVHVSPLQLGAMSIGDKWENLGMGAMNKESSLALLDAFYDAGGNFIDTANGYQDESSEELLGEWMEKRGIRDQIVLATKVRAPCLSLLPVLVGLSPTVGRRGLAVQYTTNFKRTAGDIAQKVHYVGNNVKAMHLSVEASLKKLRTSYIDILYVHWVRSLADLLASPSTVRDRLTGGDTVGLRHLHGGGHERPAQSCDIRQGFVPRESPSPWPESRNRRGRLTATRPHTGHL